MIHFRSTPWRSHSLTVHTVLAALFAALGVATTGYTLWHGAPFSLVFLYAMWSAFWIVTLWTKNSLGNRPDDYWVEVSDDGVRLSAWHFGWNGRTQTIVDVPFLSLDRVVVEHGVERDAEVSLYGIDGAHHRLNVWYLHDREDIVAFCSAVRRISPATRIHDPGNRLT